MGYGFWGQNPCKPTWEMWKCMWYEGVWVIGGMGYKRVYCTIKTMGVHWNWLHWTTAIVEGPEWRIQFHHCRYQPPNRHGTLSSGHINYTTKEVAELVFTKVYKHHGLPSKSIVSDRDALFTSIFWMHLKQLIGVKQRLYSMYHP